MKAGQTAEIQGGVRGNEETEGAPGGRREGREGETTVGRNKPHNGEGPGRQAKGRGWGGPRKAPPETAQRHRSRTTVV